VAGVSARTGSGVRSTAGGSGGSSPGSAQFALSGWEC